MPAPAALLPLPLCLCLRLHAKIPGKKMMIDKDGPNADTRNFQAKIKAGLKASKKKGLARAMLGGGGLVSHGPRALPLARAMLGGGGAREDDDAFYLFLQKQKIGCEGQGTRMDARVLLGSKFQ